MLMVTAVCLFGIREGIRAKTPRPSFDVREAVAAVWESKWEVLLPVVALVGIFGGYTTTANSTSRGTCLGF
jgi:TRAP-type C4-dicarboxylate transport system permease large subunit